MKKMLRKLTRFLAAAVPPLLASSLAFGACGNARLLNQCALYHYLVSPGQGTSASVKGNFWGLGGGNPAPGNGDDSGTYPPSDWLHFYPAGFCLGGTWAAAGVDGCVDDATTPEPKRTVVAVSDEDAAGLRGYFSLLCKERDPVSYNYDFDRFGDRVLGPIPKPRFASAFCSQGACQAQIRNPLADLQGANIALDPSCTGAIRGYKVYQQLSSFPGDPPPQSRRVDSGWQLLGEWPIGQDAGFTAQCAGAAYFALGIVFEGGFETPYVSEQVRSCQNILADRPTGPKLVPKRDSPADSRRE